MRRLVEQRIADFEEQLLDDLQLRKEAQQRLALTLSRFSPLSAYQLAGVLPSIATDVGILALGVLTAFCGAFVAFLRYDVR